MNEFITRSEQAYLADKASAKAEKEGAPRLAGLVEFLAKSTRPHFIDRAFVDAVGLREEERSEFSDRQFMVTNSKGKMESQRSLPALALLEVRAVGDKIQLIFHGDKADASLTDLKVRKQLMAEFYVQRDVTDATPGVGAKVHKTDGIAAVDQGDSVARWLTEVLGKDVRFFWQKDDLPRMREEVHAEIEWIHAALRFADSTPYTGLSFTVLDLLNDELEKTHADWYFEPLSFRMNMLFSGHINEHDAVGKFLKIGGVYFYVWRPKERCTMPAVDQETGEVRGADAAELSDQLAYKYQEELEGMHDVLHIPEAWRFAAAKREGGAPKPKAMLGVDLIPVNKGYITVGDTIEIVDELPPELRKVA